MFSQTRIHRWAAFALVALLLAAAPAGAQQTERAWELRGGRTITATFVSLQNDRVTLRQADGNVLELPLGALTPADREFVLAIGDTPRPTDAPWLEGYRVRYLLRVLNRPGEMPIDTRKTVIAQIPTGGWLTDDAHDVVAATADGQLLPTAVLAHDPRGDTIVQFLRHGDDRWYWLYAVNPDAPLPDPQLTQQMDDAKRRAEEARLAKMAAMKESAVLGETYRVIFTAVDDDHKMLIRLNEELAEWAEVMPQRQADADTTATALAAAREALVQAEQAHAPLQQAAEELSAKDAGSPEAQAARLAAAPTAAALAVAQQKVVELTPPATSAAQTLAQAQERVNAATTQKAQREAALAELEARIAISREASTSARVAARQAAEQARAAEEAYFQLASEHDPRLFGEGLTVEYRRWDGGVLSDWAGVSEGLQRSDTIIGNAVLNQVHQYLNPFRPNEPRNFAASYRGWLRVDQPGMYRFFVNSDDAVFMFIDGYRVYSRTGYNRPVDGNIPAFSIGADIELDKGVHPFEIHQVVGNSLTADGRCNVRWMIPGSQRWDYLPVSAYADALTAAPVGVAAWDGKPVAVFDFGMDDTLRSDGVSLYLTRFAAQGMATDDAALTWDFGDGTTGTGRSPSHLYFSRRDYDVSLKSHPELPAFVRRCRPWESLMPMSPLSLPRAVELLAATPIENLDSVVLEGVFHFLLICEQPTRWPLTERVARHLLTREGLDPQYRAQLYIALINAVAHQGRGDEAAPLIDKALTEVGQVRTLRATVLLEAANMYRDVLRDFGTADQLYSRIMDESERLRHPIVRQAAVAWGDMYMEAGRFAAAGQAYRLAQTLGAIGAVAEDQGDPVQRGALLRVAEQQLRAGDARQTHRLLRQIEDEFPEQRLEPLYRYLAGESDRYAGRYDSALLNYELAPQLPQGDSYRDRALLGMADTYYRMGHYDEALELLQGLAESFPEFYEKQRLVEYAQRVKTRRDALAGTDAGAATVFAGIQTGFEPDEPTTSDGRGHRPFAALGFDGPHTIFSESTRGGREVALPIQRLSNLGPQGSLWIEFWYRELLTPSGDSTRIRVQVRDDAGQNIVNDEIYPYRTYGQWHKAGFNLPAPTTLGGTVAVSVYSGGALLEIDGLKVMPVSDEQRELFRRFAEGADPQ